MKGRVIKVYGKVQGVGFRYSAQKKARKFGIVGFVRNEPDGSVYIEARGEEISLEEFIAWCRKGPWFAKVDRIEIEEANFEESEDKFTVQ